jgi:hypothetical protein
MNPRSDDEMNDTEHDDGLGITVQLQTNTKSMSEDEGGVMSPGGQFQAEEPPKVPDITEFNINPKQGCFTRKRSLSMSNLDDVDKDMETFTSLIDHCFKIQQFDRFSKNKQNSRNHLALRSRSMSESFITQKNTDCKPLAR